MLKVSIEKENKGTKISSIYKSKVLKCLFVLIFLFVLFVLFMHYLVTPIIAKTSLSKIDEISNVSLNSAIASVMSEAILYDDLVSIVTDGNGKILMLKANTPNINRLSRQMVDYTYGLLFSKLCKPLQIPFGSFCGIPAFSSAGPIVSIDIVPYGNVFCNFKSEFVSVGINQTIHKIYLTITSDVSVVMPICNIKSNNVAEAMICESIIVGEIPDTYLVADSTSDLLNMIG